MPHIYIFFLLTDTEQTQPFTETSSRSQEATSLSTEPVTSTVVVATTEVSSSSSRDWKDVVSTHQASTSYPAVSLEASSWIQTEKSRFPQDSPDTTQGDASSSMSHTDIQANSSYTSTTISRAGERTLLSVTSSSSNSTSSAFTEDSKSHQPPSTWGVHAVATETEDYTHSAPSSRTDSRDTTEQHMTHSFKGMFSETGSTGEPRGTQSLTGQPNATQHQDISTSEETSDSTPLLRMTELNTDQYGLSVSHTPSVTPPPVGSTNTSGTHQGPISSVETSTESSTGIHSSSTQNQDDTEVVSSRTTERSMDFGLTTAPPTVSISPTELDDSLTDTPEATEVFHTTTPVTVTERYIFKCFQ